MTFQKKELSKEKQFCGVGINLHLKWLLATLSVFCSQAVNAYEPWEKSPISENFQAAYDYIGQSAAHDDRGGWFNETQGIANDEEFWYFSKNVDVNENTYIFKVPYSEHLGGNFEYTL